MNWIEDGDPTQILSLGKKKHTIQQNNFMYGINNTINN